MRIFQILFPFLIISPKVAEPELDEFGGLNLKNVDVVRNLLNSRQIQILDHPPPKAMLDSHGQVYYSGKVQILDDTFEFKVKPPVGFNNFNTKSLYYPFDPHNDFHFNKEVNFSISLGADLWFSHSLYLYPHGGYSLHYSDELYNTVIQPFLKLGVQHQNTLRRLAKPDREE